MHKSVQTLADDARSIYVEHLQANGTSLQWWTAVVLTASSEKQASRFEDQLRRRRDAGTIPPNVTFVVVPDPEGKRIGNGGATFRALAELMRRAGVSDADAESWWKENRVLLLHGGGDSRGLPHYSLAGKLFSPLPVKTPWGETSTVFDELLAISTEWARRIDSGLLIGSGDVLLLFDPDEVDWKRHGVSGIAILQPLEKAERHGVYVSDQNGRVYACLQKPDEAYLRDAGGVLPGEQIALDSGLLRFDAATAAKLAALAHHPVLAPADSEYPAFDLYEHVTAAMTGQLPAAAAPEWQRLLATSLNGIPFWCSVVRGEFTHIGTTTAFRNIITEESPFSSPYAAHHRLGYQTADGVNCRGVIIDSAFTGGGDFATGVVAIECNLNTPVRAESGAILYGLSGIDTPIAVPPDTVLHQVPVALADGRRGYVIRTYGVEDDPKGTIQDGTATWFGRPILEILSVLGLSPEDVWKDILPEQRSLWNAELFPLTSRNDAWACALWFLRQSGPYAPEQWRGACRMSLDSSTHNSDSQAMAEDAKLRNREKWRMIVLSLAESGTDLRPLLANAPGVTTLTATGNALAARAAILDASTPTEAASRFYQAGLFLRHGGLPEEAEKAFTKAFACVRRGIEVQLSGTGFPSAATQWAKDSAQVAAAARLDLGGGWSDTPPFCVDWGGTVLNAAIELDGRPPIVADVQRVDEPLVRLICDGQYSEFRTADQLLAPPAPGDAFLIPRMALQMAGIVRHGESLAKRLQKLGGGIEIRTEVLLPMGSGLGTSSILAAAVLRSVGDMLGCPLDNAALTDQVMQMEQLMTTGGGWQDQIGGIYPGAKLAMSGPGARQRIRVEPIAWSDATQAEFSDRLVVYYTGIRRVARNLLRQIVGRYLAREVATIQVLHSIKTLALEMAYALRGGEWEYLGKLIDRHWELNRLLDPNTTNAPINALLNRLRPHVAGAKLAGAGGGGFLILLAKSPADAQALRQLLSERVEASSARIYQCRISPQGLASK